MCSSDYKKWREEYHNNKCIDLFMYFSPEEKELLKKFEIVLEDKLYTQFEFDVINEKLVLFYKDEDEEDMDEEIKELPNGVNRAQFNNLLSIMDRVRDKYNF